MAAYAIFIREGAVFDAAEMATYQAMTRALPPNPDIKPLSIYGKLDTLEGDAPDGVIILEFPTMAAARTWYDSPVYQAAIPHRQRAANYRAILVEGL